MKTRPILIAVLLAGGTCAASHAATFPVNHAVPDAQLDTIRGGFDFGDNLRASFALQRTVLVNGMEAMRTTISVPDIANITAQQAAQLQSALQTTVINVGSNSVNAAALAPTDAAQANATAQSAASVPAMGVQAAGAATATVNLPASITPGLVIQNSLDNQAITATTTIDASVNTARMLQNMRVAESVNDAVVQFRGN
ncbi:hypothetical protein BJI69_12330 [Luteibacter rhizovicinus DSM 16549]|uniref:Uncharacterized protein n=1 Tax=Luteibacter rhizovicinus DSM 16549 TaxID=1440763 RepID=A0A0G9HGP3_9GAMM|nr:hypothetical protein [Luteibacter rhizovicinus]APG04606.1 hypothetical protein BJI69_12330 [Luteibacter rhizovicinus DSM 16549]KLD68349.1 hypothetical protein Y883_02790 [Luteibacter rhizovicinus DSM 16549]KLD77585.1 hypothetical protein Y886_14890 [Xanthomonas hyacinthi DSM 19077]